MALQDLLRKTAAFLKQKAKEASDWYTGLVKKVQTDQKPPNLYFNTTANPELGKIYIYTYNPVLREKLPFFDMYPLTLIIGYFNGDHGAGFIGLNLHYLPPGARVALLSQLQTFRNNNKYDETTKLNVNYTRLTQDLYNSQFKECVKKYYLGHVVSSFHEIHPKDWEKVAMLPLQRWIINPNKTRSRRPPY